MKLSKIPQIHPNKDKSIDPLEKDKTSPPPKITLTKSTPTEKKAIYSPFIQKIQDQAKSLSAIDTYGNLIKQSRKIIDGFSHDPAQPPDLEEICESLVQAIEFIETQPHSLLELTLRSTPSDFLPGHLTNVAILSTALCRQLGWEGEPLLSVAVGALFHDIGMLNQKNYLNSHQLSKNEIETLRKYPQERLEFIHAFIDHLSVESKTIISNIIVQFQERINGEGLPAGLSGNQISKEAQIVGLCETYESITHPRPHRPRKLPHDALRYLLELAGVSFDGNLIKALWEALSLFPPGSFVKLSSGEIAQVLHINREFPTKPLVKIVVASDGVTVRSKTMVDLSQTPQTSIEKAVDECQLKLRDRKLKLNLKMQKWWLR